MACWPSRGPFPTSGTWRQPATTGPAGVREGRGFLALAQMKERNKGYTAGDGEKAADGEKDF